MPDVDRDAVLAANRAFYEAHEARVCIADGMLRRALATSDAMELRVVGSARKLTHGATLRCARDRCGSRLHGMVWRCRLSWSRLGYTFRTTRPSILLSRIRAKMLLIFSKGSTE